MLTHLSTFVMLLLVLSANLSFPGVRLSGLRAGPAAQTTTPAYYVATTGNDANAGTLQAPWKTLQNAANRAPSGSTVYARAGTYAGFTLSRPGITFTSYPNETAEIAGDGSHSSTVKIRDISGAAILKLVIRTNTLQYGIGLKVENASNVTIDGNMFRDNQGFGVVLKDVSNVTISNNEATHNGCAIEVRYGSSNVMIRNNRIYANDRTIDSGRAAVGITFYHTTGPVTAKNNRLWDNHTLNSTDPEGGAFEIYAASNVTMTGNVMWENETVIETGTDSARTPCNNITFTFNTAYRINRQQGMILRCASNSLVAQNTFNRLDKFAFSVSHNNGSYGASVEGLRIVNNIVTNGRVYSIDTALPASVVINYNLVYNPGSSSVYGNYLAYVTGKGNTNSFSQFKTWTGYEVKGLNVDPKFVNAGANDYHLAAGSPAIDKGLPINLTYSGAAPDMGAYEYNP